MKAYLSHFQTLALGLAVACLCPLLSAQAAGVESTQSAGNAAGGGSTGVAQASIPQSTFIIPSTPKEGRNPFFPQSTTVAPPPKPSPGVDPTTGVMLNGITSPPNRTAMINGRTFEPGEEGEVRMAGGAKLLIKCEEIKADSAVVLIGGQRRELRLRAGF